MKLYKKADWLQLVDKEPGLAELEEQILEFRATKKRLGSCVTNDWYDRFKPRVCELTGWSAQNPELRNDRAYMTAYHYLSDLLSDRKLKPIQRDRRL